MQIRLVGHSGELYMTIDKSGAWGEFIRELEKNGHTIVTEKSNSKFDVLVANSHSRLAIKECRKNKIPKEKMIIILWEPSVSDYELHSKRVLSKYGLIFSPSKEWGKGYKTVSFNWPVLGLKDEYQTVTEWSKRKNKAVLISANKFSVIKGELYSLRRKVAYLARKDGTLDLFGLKWNSGKIHDYLSYIYKLIRTPIKLVDLKSSVYLGKSYQNYVGISQDKTITYRSYKIFIILENSIEYISEKLFDAAAASGIIIYVGANISKYGIPTDAVIQVEPDANTVHSKIIELQNLSLEKQYQIMEIQQKAIISISKFWFGMDVLKKLANDISKEIVPDE